MCYNMWQSFIGKQAIERQIIMRSGCKEMVRMIGCTVMAVAVTWSASAAKEWVDANGAVWTYSVSSDKVTIRGYASPEGNVVIPASIDGKPVVTIYSKAFMDCPWIRSVQLPDCVTNIGSQAFSGCAWLESVTFPSCEFKIGSKAFYNCTRLSELKNMVTAKSVGANAFKGCDSLGKGVIVEGGWVLLVNGQCPSEVVIPEGTVGIVESAFRGCTTLQKINVPKSLEHIATSAFTGCSALLEFMVDPGNPHFQSMNGMLISKADWHLVCGVNGDAIIPDGIVEIDSNAFSGREKLTSVVIPNSVTNIGAYAFQNCKALTYIDIPGSVVQVGVNAFDGCDGLDNVDVYSLGEFNGGAKHVYTGVVLKGEEYETYESSVGIVQLTTAKETQRGVRVGGAIMLDDGKRYPIKSAQVKVENGVLKVKTTVSKLGDMTLVIGLNGFKGTVGTDYSVKSMEMSASSVLKGTISKTYIDAASGRFKTQRATLAGFLSDNSADGVIQEKGRDDRSFSAQVK